MSAGKESASSVGDGFYPWVGKILWRRERLPTPVFWPGEFHGLYSPWGHKESDMIEQLSFHFRWLLANAGDIRDAGSIPGSGRSSGGGHGNPLQCSCLEDLMDRGAWWASWGRKESDTTK